MAKNVDFKALIAKMTIEEKADQLFQLAASFFIKDRAEITGPLNNFGLDEEGMKRIGTVLGFTDAESVIKTQNKHLEEDPNKIPMVFMRDIIHGCRTIYPIPLGMGATFDTELMGECAAMAAKEASAGGAQVTFNPMVDYVRDPRWGRVMETCGEDPLLNGRMGAAQVKAFQGDDISDHDHVAACVKHFAAYGGAEAGRDYNSVELSERTLRQFYFPAYKACIDAGVKMLMPSFNNLNGIPSTANEWLMKKVLREEWGFDGLVITDYNAIGELIKHGVAADLKDAGERAFKCGCHIEMMTPSYHKHMRELIEEGRIKESELDEFVLKFLEFKDELGLFDDPYHGADPEKEAALALCPEHRAIVRRAAEESAVLLKNDGVLPFNKDVKKVALIGPYAEDHAIMGAWAASGKIEECVNMLEGVSSLLPDAEIISVKGCGMTVEDNDIDMWELIKAIDAAKKADAVILCLGEPLKYTGEGCSRVDLTLPGMQAELAKEVIKANNNTAVVLFNGRPLELTKLDAIAPAILEMWMPGTEGGNAAARLLFGEANPSGKLPMTFPKHVGQVPIYYNNTNTGRPKKKAEGVYEPYTSNYIDCGNLPLYFFGEGLSYSDFVYESMTLDKTEIDKNGEIKVLVTVRNASEKDGKEVVQLYLRDLVSNAVRPVQELIDFKKISLRAGESKTVEFTVNEPMLRYYNFACEYVSEPGEFTLSVGYANHFRFTEKFRLI